MTRGGLKLRKLIKISGLGVQGFAQRAGVDRVTLHRVLRGDRWKHITVDFALACIEAARGSMVLSVEDFASITAKPVNGEEDEPVRRKGTGTDG